MNPGAISGSISFMHGLKFAENLQFYQSDTQQLKTIEIVTYNIKVYKTMFLDSLTALANWGSNINNLDLPLKIGRQGFNG